MIDTSIIINHYLSRHRNCYPCGEHWNGCSINVPGHKTINCQKCLECKEYLDDLYLYEIGCDGNWSEFVKIKNTI